MRTLRILTLALALALALPVFAAPAFAGSGKAIFAPSQIYNTTSGTDSSSRLEMFISNISDNTIEVKLTFYNKSGNIVYETQSSGSTTGDVTAFEISQYSESTSSSAEYTASFEIGPKQTGVAKYIPTTLSSTTEYIFGTIEWKNINSNDDDQIALVAVARNYRQYVVTSRQGMAFLTISINNGMPF